MPPVGFEPTTPAGERSETYALDRAATGRSILLTVRNVSEERYTECQSTHFMFNAFCPKVVPFVTDNVAKHGTVRRATRANVKLRAEDTISVPDN